MARMGWDAVLREPSAPAARKLSPQQDTPDLEIAAMGKMSLFAHLHINIKIQNIQIKRFI